MRSTGDVEPLASSCTTAMGAMLSQSTIPRTSVRTQCVARPPSSLARTAAHRTAGQAAALRLDDVADDAVHLLQSNECVTRIRDRAFQLPLVTIEHIGAAAEAVALVRNRIIGVLQPQPASE